ncbi:MAG: hypothetical protein U1F24_08685 [Alphaproteobacteria bacterium]|jgi:hypothetical protein
MVVRLFKPELRLAKLVNEPGGRTLTAAIAEAERRVESVREDATAEIDTSIGRMAEALRSGAWLEKDTLYPLADWIFGMAGTLKLTELSQAAYSLCALLSRQAPPPTAREVELHVSTLRALRRPELAGDAAARKNVLAGLRKLAAPER